MSNSLAIAAVTGVLFDLLSRVRQPGTANEPELTDAEITRKAPDMARADESKSQLNLFLAQVSYNPAHNTRPPAGAPTHAFPPVAVSLLYLITAYGKDGDDLLAHRVLGRALRFLHDNGVLAPQLFADAVANHSELAGSNLHLQKERVRVTPHQLSLEESSKFFSMFQARYRLTVAYEVSVVFIDSARPVVAIKPVAETRVQVDPTL